MKRLSIWLCLCLVAILATLQIGTSLVRSVVYAATGDGTPTDPNITYIGHWDTSSSSTLATSYYGGAYLKTTFTGTTARLKLGGSANIYVSIDHGPDVYYAGANGIVNLTPTPLSNGEHSLRVSARSEWDQIQFQGLQLDVGAGTEQPTIAPKLVEFVGDSITAGLTSSKSALTDYAWLTGEQLGVEHTQIAFSGICLVDQCSSSTDVGMSTQFFKERTVLFPGSPDWDFSRYQPDAVVINLGTNDNGRVTATQFKDGYISFLQHIREKYPTTKIIVLSTFLGVLVAPTQDAVQARVAQGDNNVYYVDTTGWITYGPDYNDGAHPSDSGHGKVTGYLKPILQAYLTGSPQPPPDNGGLPSPWQTQDVGSTSAVGLTGSASYSNGTFTLKGSGNDIWGESDAFRYAYQPLDGNGTIIARVSSQQNTNEWAKAGLMIRDDLALGALNVSLLLTPAHGISFQYRNVTGQVSTTGASTNGTAPSWLKLVRENTTFTGYVSGNGTDWTQVGSVNIPLATRSFIGLAVSAHDNTQLSTATFDQVSRPGQGTVPPQTSTYQAESATLTNGAKTNTDHSGYSGSGFVDGYWNMGASTSFGVNVTTTGSYTLKLRYGNAMGNTRTLNLYVNNTFVKTVNLPTLTTWDAWTEQSETITLNAGSNTVTYKYDTTNNGNVNLDSLTVTNA